MVSYVKYWWEVTVGFSNTGAMNLLYLHSLRGCVAERMRGEWVGSRTAVIVLQEFCCARGGKQWGCA